MGNVAAYYRSKMGIDSKYRVGASGKKHDDGALAYTNSNDNVNYMNGNGGRFSKYLDDANNLMSIIKHENGHWLDNEVNGKATNLSTHVDVYLKQMQDDTFSLSTDHFQSSTAMSAANYILNMDKSPEYNIFDIIQKIEKFNQLAMGFELTYQNPPGAQYTKGELHLQLHHKDWVSDVNKQFKIQKY